MAHAEVIPAGGSTAATTSATPIYEYWWTIGHGGSKPEHRHLLELRSTRDFTYAAEPGARSEEALKLLGSWAATADPPESARATERT